MFIFVDPYSVHSLYCLQFCVIALNTAVCSLSNGNISLKGLRLTEDEQPRAWEKHEKESWIFLNGGAIGCAFTY